MKRIGLIFILIFGCLTIGKAQTSTENYVMKHQYRVATTSSSNPLSLPVTSVYTTIQYVDGLGRPIQNIKRKGTINQKDLIVPIDYDLFGRSVKEYLPYYDGASSQDGSFRSNAVNDQNSLTNSIYGDTYGYSENLYEASPLDRIEKKASPGSAWRLGTGKEVKQSYRTNGSSDGVRIFSVNTSGLPTTSSTYSENSLWVEIMDDEDDKRTEQYTDKLGRVILKKVQDTASPTSSGHLGWLSTYYVYDDFGNLRVVIPPQATQILLSKGWSLSTNTTLADAQFYRYTYDDKGRMVEKKIPGKGLESMLYDNQFRLVGIQDANMAAASPKEWLYTKYDGLGRVVMTGITTSNSTRASLQSTLDGMSTNNASINDNTAEIKTGSTITSANYDGYKEYVASTSITLQPGFSFKATGNQDFKAKIGTATSGSAGAWPTDEGNILTVNYYDSYQYLTDFSFVDQGSPFLPSASTRVHGLQTGTKVKNLETGEFYTSAIYYDDKGNVIQTIGQHQMGGTVRASTAYNFEKQPVRSLISNSLSSSYTVLREFTYNITGQLESITHKVGTGPTKTIASYSYDDLGRQIGKTFNDVDASANQSNSYNIRGWLTNLGSGYTGVFTETLYYNTGATNKSWNGNISRIDWTGGQDATTRTYNYNYDKANRITTATFSSSNTGENGWFNLSGITYDANGNLQTMVRKGARTATTYNTIDNLTYNYETNSIFGGEYSNKLIGVSDALTSTTYISKDFKEKSAANYGYDSNGNLKTNGDKDISNIEYNHLNLPEEVTFGSGAKIKFAYDAGGVKLTQKTYDSSGSLTKTQDYIGELVLENGGLDYLIHEEGRVAYESGIYNYEYFVKDHLGNIRQVLRNPSTQTMMATMETQSAETEEMQFSMVSESRQTEPEHNVTTGGNQVAWLNANRGRMVGPGRTQAIYAGDSLKLQVHGKYLEDKNQKANATSFMTAGGKDRLIADLNELAVSNQRAGGANPIALLNLADILAKDLQKKESPEAYLMYALYDQDSNRYEVGKKVLSRNAANQHEILEEEMYIAKDGYMETFVVNETSEDVWFDNMMVMSVSSVIVQETHYDPWGLELTGLGYQYGGVNENKWKFQGQETISDFDLNWSSFKWRNHQPEIGRFFNVDPLAEEYYHNSPYAFAENKVITFIELEGLEGVHYQDKDRITIEKNVVVLVEPTSSDYSEKKNARIEMRNAARVESISQELNSYFNESRVTDESGTAINFKFNVSSREDFDKTGMSSQEIQGEYSKIAKENGIEGTKTTFGSNIDLVAPAAVITRDGSGGSQGSARNNVVRLNYGSPEGATSHEVLHTLGVSDNGYKKGGLLNSPPQGIISTEARDALNKSYKKKDEN